MRDIFFRGKRVDNREWVHGNLINNVFVFSKTGEDIPYILCVENIDYYSFEDIVEDNGIYEVIPETVGQYTGLNDKNGKKIFEGDILKQYADTTELGTDLYFFYKVGFDESCGKFCGSINGTELYYFDDLTDSEVIGNIFDNPELLKDGEDIWIKKNLMK